MPREIPTPSSVAERLTGLARLLTSLDQRLIETFEALDRVGSAASRVDSLGDDGADLAADLRQRLAQLDERLNADLDRIRDAVLEKLGELDVADLSRRLDDMHLAIRNIERAVTRVDATVEGAVDAAPGFVAKRVKESSGKVAEHLPGRT